MWRMSIPLMAAAMAMLALVSVSTADQKAAIAKVGEKAPAFSLQDQDGKTVNLADLADKVVVLEWFNEQCPFVKKHYQNGDMNKLAAGFTERGVVWLAVNSSNFTTNEANKKTAGEWSMSRPILNDASGATGMAYGAKTTPHMYVINKGVLVYAGAIDSVSSSSADDVAGATNFVAAALNDVLDGKPVAQAETKSYGCSVKYKK